MNLQQLDKKLFWPAICFTFMALGAAVLFPEVSKTLATTGMHWATNQMGWFIQLSGFSCLIFLLYLACSRFGNIKLGQEKDQPEFSNISYAFMIFTAGVGAALIFWAVGEPMYYMQKPPMFTQVNTPESAQWLITYTLFHWGPTGWAIFCLPAVPFSYYLHCKKKRNLRLSQLCKTVIGEKNANGIVGYIIDIVAIFGTLGAFSSSMGLTVNLMGSGIQNLVGIKNNIYMQIGIVLLFIAFYALIMLLGMKKGISKLANACVIVAFLLGFLVLISGPTAFIFSYFIDSLGVMFNNYIRMSFWTDPIQKSGFPQAWTMYYWAWYFSYLIMMGVFLARISKGRTIKQLIFTTIICGSAGCAFFIAIFGGFSVYSEVSHTLPILQWMSQFGVSTAIIHTIKSLPLGALTLSVFLIVQFFMMSTSMTSTAMSVSMMTSKKLDHNADPNMSVRLVWAIGIGAVSMAAFFMGGSIEIIKSMTVIIGLPMIILYFIISICLMKWIKQDFPELCKETIFIPSNKIASLIYEKNHRSSRGIK